MNDAEYCRLVIRPKRRNGTIDPTWEKWVIPLPLRLKCEVMRLAREANLSQASFGLIVVQAALQDTTWLAAVLRTAAGKPSSGDRSVGVEAQQEKPKRKIWSEGKKLVRFHIDKELYWFAQRAAASEKTTLTAFIEAAIRNHITETLNEQMSRLTPEQAEAFAAVLDPQQAELLRNLVATRRAA